MQEQIERDLKAALLAGDRLTSETLKGIKSALQYEAVAQSVKVNDLSDEVIQKVIAKESKKRQEAAELYKNAGEQERTSKELQEKSVIDKYLPEQMTEDELLPIVEAEVSSFDNPSLKDMGKIIGAVKAKTGGSADGAVIAKLVKQRLETED
jgi:uncharacterized protein YqeY